MDLLAGDLGVPCGLSCARVLAGSVAHLDVGYSHSGAFSAEGRALLRMQSRNWNRFTDLPRA